MSSHRFAVGDPVEFGVNQTRARGVVSSIEDDARGQILTIDVEGDSPTTKTVKRRALLVDKRE